MTRDWNISHNSFTSSFPIWKSLVFLASLHCRRGIPVQCWAEVGRLSVSPLNNVSCELFGRCLYRVRLSKLLSVCWKYLSAMDVEFCQIVFLHLSRSCSFSFLSVNILNYIAFSPNVNQPYILWIRATVSWFLILFICWWVLFDKVFWRIVCICILFLYCLWFWFTG